MTALLRYSYLQLLDILTTLVFLGKGVEEINPIVRGAMTVLPSHLMALLAIKTIAVFFGVYCWQSGRARLLARANVFFAFLVAWNLVAIVLKSQST